MGWGSGSGLMGNIIARLKAKRIPSKVRKQLYAVLIPAFEESDCDTLYECCDVDKDFRAVFEKLNPPEPDDFEDEGAES